MSVVALDRQPVTLKAAASKHFSSIGRGAVGAFLRNEFEAFRSSSLDQAPHQSWMLSAITLIAVM